MAASAGRRGPPFQELIHRDSDEGPVTISNSTHTDPVTTSPDEALIQQRGHKRKSATYRFNAPDPVFFRSPTRSPKKDERPTFPTRCSPRKKLNMTPEKKNPNEAGTSELKFPVKKKRLSLENMKNPVDVEKHIKALSHAQLVKLISDISHQSPAVKETLASLIPAPDLSPIEERLTVLQKNVLKSVPRNVWGSQDSSFCFLRVRANLEAFKKECLDYLQQFVESQHWPSVFDYILIAWKLTLRLPDWSAPFQNRIKSTCIKHLATQCINAFKNSNIDQISLNEIVQRLEELGDYSEVKTCLTFAKDNTERN